MNYHCVYIVIFDLFFSSAHWVEINFEVAFLFQCSIFLFVYVFFGTPSISTFLHFNPVQGRIVPWSSALQAEKLKSRPWEKFLVNFCAYALLKALNINLLTLKKADG